LAINEHISFVVAIIDDLLYAVATVNPEPAEFGVTGISMEATLAMSYAAFDDRATVIVSGGADNFGPRDEQLATPQDTFLPPMIPGLHRLIRLGPDVNRDLGELPLLIAPRPWLIVNGDQDPLVDETFTLPDKFTRYWPKGNIQVKVEPGKHEYFIKPALEWFDTYLRKY